MFGGGMVMVVDVDLAFSNQPPLVSSSPRFRNNFDPAACNRQEHSKSPLHPILHHHHHPPLPSPSLRRAASMCSHTLPAQQRQLRRTTTSSPPRSLPFSRSGCRSDKHQT